MSAHLRKSSTSSRCRLWFAADPTPLRQRNPPPHAGRQPGSTLPPPWPGRGSLQRRCSVGERPTSDQKWLNRARQFIAVPVANAFDSNLGGCGFWKATPDEFFFGLAQPFLPAFCKLQPFRHRFVADGLDLHLSQLERGVGGNRGAIGRHAGIAARGCHPLARTPCHRLDASVAEFDVRKNAVEPLR